MKTQLQIGDIILVSGNSIVSKAIKKILDTKWTHVAIYIGGGYILEVDWNTKVGVVRNYYLPINSEFEHVILRTKDPLSLEQKRAVIKSAFEYNETGNQYDWLLLLTLLLNIKFPKFPISQSKNHYICTELVDQVLKNGGVYLFPGNKGDLLPQDFLTSEKLFKVYEYTKK